MKRFLRMVMLTLVRLYGAVGARRAASQRTTTTDAPRILLIRPDHLGDMIMVTPVLQALRSRQPGAEITMMVGAWSAEIVARHPAVDRVVLCPFPGFQRAPQKALAPYTLLWRTAGELRGHGYDLAINLRPDFWWGAALIYLAGIPQRIGYALEPGKPFLAQALPFAQPEHASVSNLRLASTALQALGAPGLTKPLTPATYPLYFRPDAGEQQWVEEILAAAHIPLEATVVVIHPGTGGAVKLWRSEAWSHIANKLVALTTLPKPVHIILTGSKTERPLVEEIAQALSPAPLLMTEMTVGQLAALLARAQLVLGVDNGPLHLAAAQDTPSLRIFGPTDPRIFGPWGDPARHRVLSTQQRCSTCPMIPCGRLDFSQEELPEHPCVRNIAEQLVMQEIVQLVTFMNGEQ